MTRGVCKAESEGASCDPDIYPNAPVQATLEGGGGGYLTVRAFDDAGNRLIQQKEDQEYDFGGCPSWYFVRFE